MDSVKIIDNHRVYMLITRGTINTRDYLPRSSLNKTTDHIKKKKKCTI